MKQAVRAMEDAMQSVVPLGVFVFLSVASVALFSFIAVATWSAERRREREAYYKSETLKKIAESQGSGAASALEFLREEERIASRRRREGQKLGGLITTAVGIALMILIAGVNRNDSEPAYLAGLIPLLVGVALLVYGYFLAPKE
jgi:peptidoglycan/LPS O-acetylase OafA/YrhL